MYVRSLSGSYGVRLGAAASPLLALLIDLVGFLQDEQFWHDAAAPVLGVGCLALWLTLPGRARPAPAALAGALLLASLGMRLARLDLDLATAFLTGGIAILLASGALVEGLARDAQSSLVAMLESWDDEAADPASRRERPAA